MSFPSFLPATRYTRPRLPSSGSLGSHFPTFSGTTRRAIFLCSATTPNSPSRLPSLIARPPIPCLFLPFVSPLKARQHSGTLVLTPGLLVQPVRLFRFSSKETVGSPKFPGYPFELRPRSSTPVVSSILAFRASRTAAFRYNDYVGFPVKKNLTIILCESISPVHDYTNFEAQYPKRGAHCHAACTLVPPGFGLPLPG